MTKTVEIIENSQRTLHIYTRVSTEAQVEKNNSLEEQERRGRDYAIRNNFGKCIIYQEKGRSASGEDLNERPMLVELLKNVSRNEVKDIFVFDLSRLSRNSLMTAYLDKQFLTHKVKLHTNTGETNFNNQGSVLVHNFMSVVSLFDGEIRKRRFQAGNIAANRNGKFTNPIPPFGWKKYDGSDKALFGHLIIDEEERNIVLQIITMYLDGMGTTQIASALNKMNIPTRMSKKCTQGYILSKGVSNRKTDILRINNKWNPGTINSMLKNTCLYGERKFKSILNEDGENEYEVVSCPPIITREEFDNLQKKRIFNHKNLKKTAKYFKLLAGLCVCNCGASMELRIKPSRGEFTYVCVSKRSSDTSCKARGINMRILNNLVWQAMCSIHHYKGEFYHLYGALFDDSKVVDTKIKTLLKEIAHSEKELANYNHRLAKLIELYTKEIIELAEYKKNYNEYIETKSKLELTILKKNEELIVLKSNAISKNDINSFYNKIKFCSKEAMRLSELGNNINDYITISEPQKEVRNFINSVVKYIKVTYEDKENEKPSHVVEIVFKDQNLHNYNYQANIDNDRMRDDLADLKRSVLCKTVPFSHPTIITEPCR